MRHQEIGCDFLNYETNEGELLEMAIAMSLSEEEFRAKREEERAEEELARILALSLQEK